ncbi:Nuclear transcription factor Y subunit C-1 [Capsicum annuum]|uniref:Nuclear transcription factor Y subunit C-1 n=1 Tax=Capsicum annuum TaxID=4072 RepID=A0A2G2XWF1_CAPAN|nr:Nuclear transcription factor Y subunit C-1 [Capsicum annuum]
MNAAAVAAAAVGGYPYNHQLAQKQQLEMFWHFKRHEIEHSTNLRNHQLPLARIRKIAKDTPNVKKISAEVPILFSKACELFIQEFTLRSWFHADENNRYSIQGNDVAAAIRRTDHFDFLAHVPTDEIMGEATAAATVTGVVGSTSSGVPDYNPPMGQPGPSEVTMGRASVPLPQPPPSQECQWVWQPVEDNPDNPSGDGGYVIACQLEVGFDMQMIYASTDDTIELNWTHCAVLSLFGKLSEFSIVDGDASFISALSQDRMVMIIRSGLLMMVLMACRAIVLISRKPFKVYDMVEALGDYTEMKGVTVAPLVKVPSYFLRGREAPNAPTGCWELDLAVLPMELLEVIIDA